MQVFFFSRLSRHPQIKHLPLINRFTASDNLFTFMNLPAFIDKFHDPGSRERMQPSLVFSGLALAQLLQSSELAQGAAGRDRAYRLRDAAESGLNAAISVRWFDPGLAQAAWVRHSFFHPSKSISHTLYLSHLNISRCSLYSKPAATPNTHTSASSAQSGASTPSSRHSVSHASTQTTQTPRSSSPIPSPVFRGKTRRCCYPR